MRSTDIQPSNSQKCFILIFATRVQSGKKSGESTPTIFISPRLGSTSETVEFDGTRALAGTHERIFKSAMAEKLKGDCLLEQSFVE